MDQSTSKPTDGNPPAPILNVPGLLRKPWSESQALADWIDIDKTTRSGVPADKHGNFNTPNAARRAVHAGSLSHDTDERTI